jgi:hypothetical protein
MLIEMGSSNPPFKCLGSCIWAVHMALFHKQESGKVVDWVLSALDLQLLDLLSLCH